MKNTITIVLLLFFINMKSQVTEILPINTSVINQQNGAYFKDIDNDFNFYVGTWEGTLNNKKYTFEFTKFEQIQYGTPENYNYYDELAVKFKVIDMATNQIIYSNLSATNYSDYLIKGYNIPAHGLTFFYFTDTDANCNNTAEFTIRRNKNNNFAIEYCYYLDGENWSPEKCGKTESDYAYKRTIPIFLPKQNLILEKL